MTVDSQQSAEWILEIGICLEFGMLGFGSYLCTMLDYPTKILLAFGETISGNDKIFQWLLKNGYPELAALSRAITGSEEAFNWLMKNGYPHFAALDHAIDNKLQAREWLVRNHYELLVLFADACNERPEAVKWFRDHDLTIFLILAQKIIAFRNNQTYDYHKMHF